MSGVVGRKFSEAGRAGIRAREAARREALLAYGFWKRVDKSAGPDACWPWTGTQQVDRFGRREGYGYISIHGKVVYVHRLALASALGRPIAPGMEVMHLCDNPPCCNPAHLNEGTHAENMQDAGRKGRLARRWKQAA